MATARTSTSSNSSNDSFSQNTDLQNAIADFVTTTVNEILKTQEAETKEEMENEIERRVAMAITDFTNSTNDQRLFDMIARQSVVVNKLLEKQTNFDTNQLGLLSKFEDLCDKTAEIDSNMKELQKWFDQLVLSNTNSPNLHSPIPSPSVTEKQIQTTDSDLAFFMARVPFGLTCPPPKIPSVELLDQEMPSYSPLYGSPPERFPTLPDLICRLFAELGIEN